MGSLEPEADRYEECLSWDDGIYAVLACERIVNRFNVKKPVYIGALRSFPED